MTAKEIATKYVRGLHDALTDRQEIIDMAKDIMEYAQSYHTAKLEEVKGFSSDEEIEAMIKVSELKARSAEEWLSLFEGAQWMRSIDQSILAKKDAEISTLKAEIANLKEANIECIGEIADLEFKISALNDKLENQ